MSRILLSLSVVFAFGAMCTGAGTGTELVDEDPVVVPVDGDKDKDAEAEYWCCEYKDDVGATQYALVDGPSQCNDQFGTKDGRYVSGNQCIPCCCETDKDPADASKGQVYELTTPKSCNAVAGECKEAGHAECADDAKADKDEKKTVKPRPRAQPVPRAPATRVPDRDNRH